MARASSASSISPPPAVAGQVPELLNPTYRLLLWSWTPFRFSAGGLRSLMFLGSQAADVAVAVEIFAAATVVGLALIFGSLVAGRETA